jgi:hypothetical protein
MENHLICKAHTTVFVPKKAKIEKDLYLEQKIFLSNKSYDLAV